MKSFVSRRLAALCLASFLVLIGHALAEETAVNPLPALVAAAGWGYFNSPYSEGVIRADLDAGAIDLDSSAYGYTSIQRVASAKAYNGKQSEFRTEVCLPVMKRLLACKNAASALEIEDLPEGRTPLDIVLAGNAAAPTQEQINSGDEPNLDQLSLLVLDHSVDLDVDITPDQRERCLLRPEELSLRTRLRLAEDWLDTQGKLEPRLYEGERSSLFDKAENIINTERGDDPDLNEALTLAHGLGYNKVVFALTAMGMFSVKQMSELPDATIVKVAEYHLQPKESEVGVNVQVSVALLYCAGQFPKFKSLLEEAFRSESVRVVQWLLNKNKDLAQHYVATVDGVQRLKLIDSKLNDLKQRGENDERKRLRMMVQMMLYLDVTNTQVKNAFDNGMVNVLPHILQKMDAEKRLSQAEKLLASSNHDETLVNWYLYTSPGSMERLFEPLFESSVNSGNVLVVKKLLKDNANLFTSPAAHDNQQVLLNLRLKLDQMMPMRLQIADHELSLEAPSEPLVQFLLLSQGNSSLQRDLELGFASSLVHVLKWLLNAPAHAEVIQGESIVEWRLTSANATLNQAPRSQSDDALLNLVLFLQETKPFQVEASLIEAVRAYSQTTNDALLKYCGAQRDAPTLIADGDDSAEFASAAGSQADEKFASATDPQADEKFASATDSQADEKFASATDSQADEKFASATDSQKKSALAAGSREELSLAAKYQESASAEQQGNSSIGITGRFAEKISSWSKRFFGWIAKW